MRPYNALFTVVAFVLTFSGCVRPGIEKGEESNATLVEVANGYSGTSVNTAVFRQSSLVSNDSLQYIAYYNADGNMVLGRRRLDSTQWEITATPFTGKINDAHNIISIGLDGDGFLHVAFNHHGDTLHYARAVEPGSLQLTPLLPMTGRNEEHVTYPEFHSLPNGDMLFVYRDGRSGNGDMAINHYSTATREWNNLHSNLIDGQGERNAYWQMFVDNNGTVHLSWVWRETPGVETNHDMHYARSRNGGITWETVDSIPYQLPITMETAQPVWTIPQGHELINQTSMTADNNGNPYIATYWRDDESQVPQYRIIWHNGREWNMSQVGERTTPFSLSGRGTKMIPIARPRIVSDGEAAYLILRDEERGSKVTIAYNPDIANGEWEFHDVTNFSVDAWEPSIDNNLWNRQQKLNIFVQRTHQGDGEKVSGHKELETPVYVLEYQL